MELFWKKVEKTKTCWLWIGLKTKGGYGTFYLAGKYRLAHRLSYALEHGRVPKGKVIDHLCRNRPCVNPAHLEAVTQKINMQRGMLATRTHCDHGHEFTKENTRVHNHDGGTRRVCRQCHAIESNERYYKLLRNPNAGPKNSLKTHCKYGHALNIGNLLPRTDGRRACRACYERRKSEGYFKSTEV